MGHYKSGEAGITLQGILQAVWRSTVIPSMPLTGTNFLSRHYKTGRPAMGDEVAGTNEDCVTSEAEQRIKLKSSATENMDPLFRWTNMRAGDKWVLCRMEVVTIAFFLSFCQDWWSLTSPAPYLLQAWQAAFTQNLLTSVRADQLFILQLYYISVY